MSASTDVASRMARMSALESQLSAAQSAVKKIEAELEVEQKALLKILRQGGTTGDPFKDAFVKHYGFDNKLEAVYRELHTQLAEHKGQAVLICYQGEVLAGPSFSSFILGPEYEDAVVYRLGFFEEEGLRVAQRGGLRIPISCYVEGVLLPFSRRSKQKVWAGDLFAQRYGRADPPLFDMYMFNKMGTDKAVFALVVGDKAAQDFLNERSCGNLFESAAHALGIQLEPA